MSLLWKMLCELFTDGKQIRRCEYCNTQLEAEVQYAAKHVPAGAKDLGIKEKSVRPICPGCGWKDDEWHSYQYKIVNGGHLYYWPDY